MKKKIPPDLNKVAKSIKGRVKVLTVLPYHGINVYVMQFDKDLFAYFLAYENQIYFAYVVVPLEKGRRTYTRKQLNSVIQIVLAGAHTTIEHLLKINDEEIERQKALAKVIIKSNKNKVLTN